VDVATNNTVPVLLNKNVEMGSPTFNLEHQDLRSKSYTVNFESETSAILPTMENNY
jgi:hypothetical protein